MKNIFMIGTALCVATAASAQDAQLSQLNNAPVLLNPAQTGLFDANYRVSGGIRNTSFGQATTAYQNGYLSVEGRVRSSWIPADDRFGVGVYGYFDQSSAGALKGSWLGASVAYSKSLSPSGATRIGVGVQGVFAARRLDLTKVYFEDQVGSNGITTLPSRDASRGGSDQYFDLNAGVQLSHDGAQWGGTIGGSLQHVARPKESFWGADYQLPLCYKAHGSFFVKMGPGGADRLRFEAIYSAQGSFAYFQGGAFYAKAFDNTEKSGAIEAGMMARDTRALIPYLGLRFGRTGGGVSYDLTTRKETQAGLNRHSLEISLSHTF